MNSDQVKELRQSKYNATLVWIHESNPELRILRVQPDFVVPEHHPGQYSTLGLGNWEPRAPDCQEENLQPGQETQMIRRAYSISSSILDESGQLFDYTRTNWLEFYIVLVRATDSEPPALTPRLFLLQEGDRLFLGPKITGHYTIAAVKPDDSVVFLSTGTGEAPNNYMTWDLLRKGHRGRIISACCVRFQADLAYRAIHEQLMARYPNYGYVWLTTRDPTVTKKVYIQELIQSGQLEEKLGTSLDPGKTHVFLCGNPNMIGVPVINRDTGERTYPNTLGVIEILEKRGFQVDQPSRKIQGNIHFEEYW
jgi:ferredoxin--NADP+ reductase